MSGPCSVISGARRFPSPSPEISERRKIFAKSRTQLRTDSVQFSIGFSTGDFRGPEISGPGSDISGHKLQFFAKSHLLSALIFSQLGSEFLPEISGVRKFPDLSSEISGLEIPNG